MRETLEALIPDPPPSSFFPPFFLFFCLLYLFAYFVPFRRWAPRDRHEGSSCFISLFHGTPAAALSVLSATLLPLPPLPIPAPFFTSPNTPLQSLTLDFSAAYFAVDILHYLAAFEPGDGLFVAHHLATLFVLLTCRHWALHGARAVLALLAIAEVTSACQNAWTLAGMRRPHSRLAAAVYGALSPPFYAMYTVARGVFGVGFFVEMTRFYLRGGARDVIPYWVSASWVVVVGAAIAISMLWIVARWTELHQEMARGGAKEKKTM